MIESLSSCNEDVNFKRSSKKTSSRIPSRNRTYIFPCSRGSSGPNCESDSEGVLTSRAIERLSLCDGKRSVESDYGMPQYSTSKKSVRRRRKTKDSTPMQIDNGLFSNDTIRAFRRERRSLGKRKRWVEADKSSIKSLTSQGDVLDIDKNSLSDGESVDSVLSIKIVEPCFTEEDTARDGDDEQSDWYQEFGLSSGVTPLYEITVSAFFDRTKTPRNSDDNSLSNKKLQRSVSKDGFSRSCNSFNKQLYRRSIKTGNRRLLSRNMERNKSSNDNSRSFPPKLPNKSLTDRHRKFSNKRLRCGSSTFTSFCESNNQMDVISSHTSETIFNRPGTLLPQPTGKPPFKKGATEKQIFGNLQ